jgi:hypothetical protein
LDAGLAGEGQEARQEGSRARSGLKHNEHDDVKIKTKQNETRRKTKQNEKENETK